jgi:hypothetical protein
MNSLFLLLKRMNQNFIYTLERIIFIFRREGKLGVLLCLFFETYHRSIVYKNSLLLFKMAIITVDVNLFRFQRHCDSDGARVADTWLPAAQVAREPAGLIGIGTNPSRTSSSKS